MVVVQIFREVKEVIHVLVEVRVVVLRHADTSTCPRP
jgi:hypothetical protein